MGVPLVELVLESLVSLHMGLESSFSAEEHEDGADNGESGSHNDWLSLCSGSDSAPLTCSSSSSSWSLSSFTVTTLEVVFLRCWTCSTSQSRLTNSGATGRSSRPEPNNSEIQ